MGVAVAAAGLRGDDGALVTHILLHGDPEAYGVRVFWAIKKDDGGVEVVSFFNEKPAGWEDAQYGDDKLPLPYAGVCPPREV